MISNCKDLQENILKLIILYCPFLQEIIYERVYSQTSFAKNKL